MNNGHLFRSIIIVLFLFQFPIFAEEDRMNEEQLIELEIDRQTVQNDSNNADEVADKWYKRGNKDIALEFDKIYLQRYANLGEEIAGKWNERGDKEVLKELEKLFPLVALEKLYDLIESGKFAEAEEYGNKMLEYWVSQDDE